MFVLTLILMFVFGLSGCKEFPPESGKAIGGDETDMVDPACYDACIPECEDMDLYGGASQEDIDLCYEGCYYDCLIDWKIK